MYLYLIIYVVRWGRKLSGVYLWDTTVKRKDGDVVILQMESATQPEMWSLMKHPRGGPKIGDIARLRCL